MKIHFIKNNINVTFSFNPNDCIIINYSSYRSKIPGKLESQSYSSQLPCTFRLLYPEKKKTFSHYFWETVVTNIEILPQSLKILLSGLKKRTINSISSKKHYVMTIQFIQITPRSCRYIEHTHQILLSIGLNPAELIRKRDSHCQRVIKLYSFTNSTYTTSNLLSLV